jgi:rubrerythrin
MNNSLRRPFARSLAALVAVAGTVAFAIPAAHAQSVSADQLLVNAAKTESAAYLQYYGYATQADRTNHAQDANDWRIVARVEHQDHWTHEVTLANVYSGSNNVANLRTAITQARQVADQDRSYAAMMPNSKAAQVLRTIAARENGDVTLLSEALQAEQGHRSIPAAPSVTTVKEMVSSQPKYTGTFYNDLTGANPSALEGSAWLWAEYQYLAKTAVDTGQARLAKLFSRLANQEQSENWVQISNAAGYVNGLDLNLEASIAGEQGAIDMYTQYASESKSSGHPSIAKVFTSIKGDEAGHRHTFTDELHKSTVIR